MMLRSLFNMRLNREPPPVPTPAASCARCAELADALQKCHAQFAFLAFAYESTGKPTDEAKAKVMYRYEALCDNALTGSSTAVS